MPPVNAPSSVNGVATKRVSFVAAATAFTAAQKLKVEAKRIFRVMEGHVNLMRAEWPKLRANGNAKFFDKKDQTLRLFGTGKSNGV